MIYNKCAEGRIAWIDYLKGVTIILVIVGHTINNFFVRSFIFSFHMPLFFFLSGYTFQASNNKEMLIAGFKKSARRLILPAYCIWIVRSILYTIVNKEYYTIKEYILSAIYASGTETTINNFTVPAFGMMWFLVVLFLCRMIYDLIQLTVRNRKVRGVTIFCICVIGIIVGQRVYLPFSIDVALVSTLFFYTGVLLHEQNNTVGQNAGIRRNCVISSLLIWGGYSGYR